MVKLTIELSVEQLEDIMEKVFNKSKNKFNVPGSHEDKAPRAMIEKVYGEDIFYEDAADEAINTACMEAMNESGLEITSRPGVIVDQIGKDKPFIHTATIAIKSEVTLDEYKGIEVKKVDTAVRPEDVKAELKKVQEQNARLLTVEDRPIADGDQTVINFEGFIDGKTLDDDKVTGYPLTVGSHSFTNTFGEQLVGRNIREKCGTSVTLPEEYHAAELAGKPTTFRVAAEEIKIKELPELNDELVGEVSKFGTLDECRKNIEVKILKREQKEAAPENENRVVNKVTAGVSMEIFDRMVEGQIDDMVQDTARHIESQGLSMDLYTKYTGTTMKQMREQVKPRTLEGMQTRPALKEAVKAENLQASGEKLDEEITKMAAAYWMEADKLGDYISDRDKDQMKGDTAVQEVIDLLVVEAKLI